MRIMAVTKNVLLERILTVLQEENINLIGESRWQEAKEKLPRLPTAIEKHFIGHLQTNKVGEVTRAFDCIESVDSVKLAKAVNDAASQAKKTMPIFLQVNISRDPAKHGFMPEGLGQAISLIRALPHVSLDGLMTITARAAAAQVRADFRKMKQLQQQFQLAELSMGMSSDWQIAAEEGATIVRLGSALFGPRPAGLNASAYRQA